MRMMMHCHSSSSTSCAGGEWLFGDAILNDVNVKVAEAVTPCGIEWSQEGHDCYHGSRRASTWQEAQMVIHPTEYIITSNVYHVFVKLYVLYFPSSCEQLRRCRSARNTVVI